MGSICTKNPETTIKKPANNLFIAPNVSSGVFWHALCLEVAEAVESLGDDIRGVVKS